MTLPASQTERRPLDPVAAFAPLSSRALRRLDLFLDARWLEAPLGRSRVKLSCVLGLEGLGQKNEARAYAAKHQLDYLPVTLGLFVGDSRRPLERACSWLLGNRSAANSEDPWDTLERLLEDDDPARPLGSPENLKRATRLRDTITCEGLSRFTDEHHIPEELETELAAVAQRPVVVVFQSECCLDPATTDTALHQLHELLALATASHGGSPVLLLEDTSPLSRNLSRLRPEHHRALRSRYATLRILPLNVDKSWLFERTAMLYTVDSLVGFEALLRRVPVTVLGSPFYSHRGLTLDRAPSPAPRRARSLDELIVASLILAPKYYDPVSDRETTPEAALEHQALIRKRYLDNCGHFLCVGFSLWKRAILRGYLRAQGNHIEFLKGPEDLRSCLAKLTAQRRLGQLPLRVVVWASRPHDEEASLASQFGVPLLRVEDGFLRSTGLGSDWAAPGSLVFDTRGIYYDPRQPSDLEEFLSHADIGERELTEAEDLRSLIVELRISKYNTHQERPFTPRCRPGQRVVLVPGQVADDASVRLGGAEVCTVEAMLERVRALEPGAHIVYKPHPDVLSGNRRGLVDQGLGTWFDELVLDVPLARCLDSAHAVHTISSLVGFEALLRGLPVTCHGQPFYCGWGLTQDRAPVTRRNRRLTLPMLVAIVLLKYPRYYHFPSGSFCSASQMVSVLAEAKSASHLASKYPKWIRRAHSLLQLALDLRHAG